MKMIRGILLLLIFAATSLSYGQWTQTNGPSEDATGLSFFTIDTFNLASSQCGIYKSTSINDKWQLISPMEAVCFTLNGDTLIFGSGYASNGIYFADLQSSSFDPTEGGLEYYNVFDVFVKNEYIYTATDPGGFMLTNDAGNTWNKFNQGLPEDSVITPVGTYYFNRVFSIELIKERVFAGTPSGVFRADISTLQWTPVNTGLTEEAITVMLAWDDNLYIAIGNEVFMSKNYGDSWGKIYTCPHEITSILGISNTIYVGSNGSGIAYTSDEGLTWMSLNNGLTDVNIKSLSTRGPTLIAGTSSEGFFYQDEGVWHEWSEGIICSNIRTMASNDTEIYANTSQGVYLSEDHGQTWQDISPQVEKTYFGSITSMGDTLFLTYTFYVPNPYFENNQKIIYTIDKGKSWHNLYSDVPYWGDDTYWLYVDGIRLYAREDEHLYFTEDLGITWNDMSLPEEFCNMFYGFGVKDGIPVALACGGAEFLRYTKPAGWQQYASGLNQSQSIYNMHFSEDAIFLQDGNYDIYISKTLGNSWEKTSPISIFPDAFTRYSSALSLNLFVTTQAGIALTTDYGQSWIDAGDGLINSNIGPIILFNDTLYIGTYGNGVWKRYVFDFSLGIESPGKKTSIHVYPNPSSGLVFINIPKGHNGEMTVNIFDLAGKKLYDKTSDKGQFHPLTLDLSQYQPGCYIVYVKSPETIFTAKIIVNH